MAQRVLPQARQRPELSGWWTVLRAPALWVVLLTLCAAAVRAYRLAGPVLRWDEGWSLAHASLPWLDLWQVAAADRHPPLYIALLKLWVGGGRSAWSIRYLSLLMGTLAVPLAYQVARRWSENIRTGLLSAGFVTFWPLLVYYGQVTRMYALSAVAVLAAAWFMLEGERKPSWRSDLGLVASAGIALYTLYPTAWTLAGLWAYAAISQPRRIPRLLALGLSVLALYLPWVLAAQATILERISAEQAGAAPLQSTLRVIRPTLEGLAFVYGARPWAAVALGTVVAVGLLVGPWSRREAQRLLLPLLTVGISAAGVAYSVRALWFAVRHLVPAAPFLGLLVAQALSRLAGRWRPLLAAALVALAVAYWPTCSRFVYEKTLEVTDPFDPTEDYRYLAEHAGPNDFVYFNVLARAGWYESLRGPQDPAWSYAMRWEPVIEPLERITARLDRDRHSHHRLWFVLHKGNFGPNAALVDWLAANLYPSGGEWQGDTLYLAYVAPPDRWAEAACDDRFEPGIRLLQARWTPQVAPGDACALELTWEAERAIDAGYKVFVHAVDEAGQLVAQHDGIPAAGLQPTNAWPAGAPITDRHGLLLPPAEASTGRLRILVGLYDAETGQRLPLAGGGDAVELCTIDLVK